MRPSVQKIKNNKLIIFSFLKHFISDNFPTFSVCYDDEQIYIEGKLKDSDWQNDYELLICSSLSSSPKAFIIRPEIAPQLSIHMYKNRSLCLYHPKDLPRNYHFFFVKDIIPWLIKWVHYYEIWLRNGNIWIGPEAPHA